MPPLRSVSQEEEDVAAVLGVSADAVAAWTVPRKNRMTFGEVRWVGAGTGRLCLEAAGQDDRTTGRATVCMNPRSPYLLYGCGRLGRSFLAAGRVGILHAPFLEIGCPRRVVCAPILVASLAKDASPCQSQLHYAFRDLGGEWG